MAFLHFERKKGGRGRQIAPSSSAFGLAHGVYCTTWRKTRAAGGAIETEKINYYNYSPNFLLGANARGGKKLANINAFAPPKKIQQSAIRICTKKIVFFVGGHSAWVAMRHFNDCNECLSTASLVHLQLSLSSPSHSTVSLFLRFPTFYTHTALTHLSS